MNEVLSQQEIDSLLQALDSGTLDLGEEKEKEVETRSYDFRRPNKFSHEHLRTLEMVHQHFARLLSNFLSGYLRSSINLEVVSVGQMIYDEFINSVPSPTVLTTFSADPLPGSALLETNIQFATPVIDLLLGGEGSALALERELTDIELAVLKRLYVKLLENLALAWKDVFEITPAIQHLETNPRMYQLYSANEVVALITLTVFINEESRGMINICFPFMVLEPAMSMLSIRQQFQVRQEQGPKEEDLRLIKHWVCESDVEVDVQLGFAEITVEDFLQIETGDVLVLEQRIDQDLILNVEGVPKFGVQTGELNKQKAVQIVSLKKGESQSA